MKIKIWRQFASNHSNSFTVIGTFPSVEEAEKAASILHQLFEDIFNQGIGYYDREPLWAEIEIAQKYGIEEWDQHLDWLDCVGKLQSDIIHRFNRHIVITNGQCDTWQGPTAIPELMSKLGAEVLAEAEMQPGTLFVDLGFTAPNLDTAEKTFSDLNAHADGPFSLKTMMDSVYKRSLEVTQEDDATKLHLYKLSLDIDMDDDSKLARYGRIIKLNRLHFASIGYALPAILHWLEVEGYTDVNYRIYTDEWKQSR